VFGLAAALPASARGQVVRSTEGGERRLTGPSSPLLRGEVGQTQASTTQASNTQASNTPTGQPVGTEPAALHTDDERRFRCHVAALAAPEMEGRAPGSAGLELAVQYLERHFRAAGLHPPFESPSGDDTAGTESPAESPAEAPAEAPAACGSYRQHFEFMDRMRVAEGQLVFGDAGLKFVHGEEHDFIVTTMGGSADVRGPLVFVGYGIDRGPEKERDFSSFPEGLDLTGKVALVLRFEPLDEHGRSRWGAGNWTRRASLSEKLAALERLGAAGAILINTPGVDDPRNEALVTPMGVAREYVRFPVLHASLAAGQRIVAAFEPAGRSLEELRRLADEGPLAVEMKQPVTLRARLVRDRVPVANVVGSLPGRGALAAQHIVIAAHVDHLGLGDYGSWDQELAGQTLHPGADGGASGCAALLMLAERLAGEYEAQPAEASARGVVFIAFNGSEAGLQGAHYYVEHPLVPLAQHVLMLNIGRIGRVQSERLFLVGASSGVGLAEHLAPLLASSSLQVEQPRRIGGMSDQGLFLAQRIPALYAICDLHDDFRTPRDTVERLNVPDAVRVIDLLHSIAKASVTRAEPFPFR